MKQEEIKLKVKGRRICHIKPERHSEDLEEAAEKFVYDWAGLSPTERRIAERAYLAGAEWMAEQFRKELDKWEDHSIRGMEKGNVAYFQGRVALCVELLSYLSDYKEDKK